MEVPRHSAARAYGDMARSISDVTLGQIWSSLNRPLPRSVTVLAITLAVLYLGRRWGRQLYTYRRAREVYAFAWPTPEVR
jgi:hypothetical protein